LHQSALVFDKVRIGVHDIKYFDPARKESIPIDGVFGSNFLCSSAKMEGLLPSETSETAFDYVVLDFKKGTAGFVLNHTFKRPLKRGVGDREASGRR
jgi:hypothetical protein